MKIAFLILAHKNPRQLVHLFKMLEHENAGVFLHLDKRVNLSEFTLEFEKHNVSPDFICRDQKIVYSSITYIYATLKLLKEAYNRGCEYFVLISGQDIPVKPINEIVEFFEKNKDKNYISYTPIPIFTCDPGLAVKKSGSIIINSNAKIGANCVIHSCVNIGTEAGYADKAPTIGDNVYVGSGAVIFGGVTIASNSAIGASAIFNRSFTKEGSVIASVPARVIGKVVISYVLIKTTVLLKKGFDFAIIKGKPAKEVSKTK